MRTALLLLVLLAAFAFADSAPRKFDYSEFGKKIELKKQGMSDKLAFGITFSLGASDPDGNNWLINLTKSGPLPKGTTWNLYRMDSKSYEFGKWKEAASGELFSSRLSDKEAQSILPHQKDLILVFKLPNGELTYLPLGEMCEDSNFKDYFKNLTDSKRCHEITEKDVKSPGDAHSRGSSH